MSYPGEVVFKHSVVTNQTSCSQRPTESQTRDPRSKTESLQNAHAQGHFGQGHSLQNEKVLEGDRYSIRETVVPKMEKVRMMHSVEGTTFASQVEGLYTHIIKACKFGVVDFATWNVSCRVHLLVYAAFSPKFIVVGISRSSVMDCSTYVSSALMLSFH